MGIDRVLPEGPKPENVSFAKGDFTKIPLADSSVNVVTAHWSVINDLAARSLHVPGFGEVARVLKKGGEFYFDVPYLEGGEGSWEKAAQEYHQKNPDQPYGIIKADFPGGRSKEFYIYPEAELEAMLKASGFEVKKEEAWRTEAGKPRKVIVAKLVNKVTPRVVAA
jgi:ubiquinone/menaquinone biosynthesis C-methylase UbiE